MAVTLPGVSHPLNTSSVPKEGGLSWPDEIPVPKSFFERCRASDSAGERGFCFFLVLSDTQLSSFPLPKKGTEVSTFRK